MSVAISKEDIIQRQILEAAKRLFDVYGVAKITMEDVAKAIGKSRSSLYYYYKSKDELLAAVIMTEILEVRGEMEKAVNQAATVEAKINAIFTVKLNMSREKHSFFSKLETGMDIDAISSFRKIKIAHHDQTIKWESALLTKIVNEGVKKGELATVKPREMETLIFVLVSCLHGLKFEMRAENHVRDIKTVAAKFAKVVLHGLGK